MVKGMAFAATTWLSLSISVPGGSHFLSLSLTQVLGLQNGKGNGICPKAIVIHEKCKPSAQPPGLNIQYC